MNRVAVSSRVSSRFAATALGALALFIFYGSGSPWAGDAPRVAELPGFSLPDFLQNVILYIPFGVFGMWTLRGLRPSSLRFLLVIALALAYSCAMELLQMRLADRIASPLDVAANFAGASIGALVAGPVERPLGALGGMMDAAGLYSTPVRYVFVAVLVVLVTAAWYPFDITLDVSTLGERTRAIRRDMWLSPAPSEIWSQAGRFALLTVTTAFSLPRLRRRALPIAFAFAVLAAAVIDVGQLAMGSQPIGLTAFASQATGAGAAAALLGIFVRRTEYAAA
jgi:VanZ family protein